MGSKMLKAVAVRGSKGIKPANPEAFSKLYESHRKQIIEDHFLGERWTKYGTTVLVEAMNEIGRFPTKNFQTGVFPFASEISGDVLVERYKVRDRSCLSCQLGCKNHLRIRSGPYAGSSGICPEYETISSLGGRCWNRDIEFLMHAGWLCDEYGLDTISTGAVIAFAMELWEKRILTKKDTGGLDFSWGNTETMEKMIHLIAKREGFGNLLADGVSKAAEKIGKGANKYAMHVKGLDIAAQDGRAQKSMAIAHATSVRGADHLRHCTFFDEIGSPDAIEKRWGKKYLPEIADRLEIKYKGIMAKDCEDFTTLIDSLGICTSTFQLLWFKDLAELYTAVVGIKVNSKSIQMIAERIADHKRAYNIKLCFSRKNDNLPERFLKEAAPDGPCKGQVVELKPMLEEYYRQRGYDVETGFIPRARLEKLGLKYVAAELGKMSKLPKETIKSK
jgi:aldehyde:ferredoxin oxidoreductase